jgi:outer membrane protein
MEIMLMKRSLRALLFILFSFSFSPIAAQDSAAVVNTKLLKFAYLSYEQALKAMPDYQLVQMSLSDLRAQYEAEQQRVEQDFNIKYEEFLEGQRDFPESILRKRQTELKELLERNIAFKAESRQQIARAEEEKLSPLKAKLEEILTRIGLERGYAFILNTDANAAPFLHPALGEDITDLVNTAIQKQNTLKRVFR